MSAMLDPLSQNVAFPLALRDSGVQFAAVDIPEANDLTVGITALVVDEVRDDRATRHRRFHHGHLAARQTRCPAASLGPGQPIGQRAVSEAHG